MKRRMSLPAVALASLAAASAPALAPAKTTLFVTNFVNSNEIQSITAWNGLLTMGTLGGVVTYDTGSGTFRKILRSTGGLPSNRVLAVAVSPSGSLWAGTAESGIARIRPDGTFRRTLSSFDGLPTDHVQVLYVHSDSIWVGTDGGLALFTENPATGQIGLTRAYTSASTGGGLAGDDVRAFLQVGDTLWCATLQGLSSFTNGAWQNRTAALSIGATSLALHADTLWAGTVQGPYLDVGGVFQPRNAGHSPASNVLYEDGSGFYSGTPTFGVFRWDGALWNPMNGGLPSFSVAALRDGPDGALWVGTDAGAARLAGSTWETHRSDGPLVNGAQRAVADSRGVWIATGNDFAPGTGRGVVLHFDGNVWSALSDASTAGGLQQTDVFGILSDRSETLWFGHCCLDGTPRPRVDRWDPAANAWDAVPVYNIWALDQSPSGDVFAVSVEHENGVYVIDRQTGALIDSLTPMNSPISSNNLRAVRFDGAGKGWFGTAFNGFDVWDGRGTATHVDDLWSHYTAQPSNQVTSLAVLSPTAAWVGTVSGVGRFESGIFGRVLTVAGSPGLPSGQVNDLALDPRGNLWIGTSAGLVRADASGFGAIEVFTTADGLVDDEIRALAWDPYHDALWIGTAHGISRAVPSTGQEAFDDRSYVYPNPSRAAGGSLKLGGIQNVVEGEIRDLTGTVIHRFRCDPAANEAWDLKLEGGAPAPSGLYLVVLRDRGRSRILRAAVVR